MNANDRGSDMTATLGQLRRIPILGDLEERELATIAGFFSDASVATGETVYAEGEEAGSACFLVDGRLEASKALPGGGATRLGVIETGSMIGEMALLTGGTRSATVTALSQSRILTVSRHFFHAALDQASTPAYKILRSVVASMATRLEGLRGRILEQWGCEACDPPSSAPAPRERKTVPATSFDYRPFLPVIPFFSGFTDDEIDRLLASAGVLELAAGEFLYREGTPADDVFIVVRGALEASVVRDRRYQLSILGPGRLCGANSQIAGTARTSDARARSAALLLSLDQTAFRALYRGAASECLKFQRMISVDQLKALRVADNLLSTLVSQNHVLEGARSVV